MRQLGLNSDIRTQYREGTKFQILAEVCYPFSIPSNGSSAMHILRATAHHQEHLQRLGAYTNIHAVGASIRAAKV